MARFKPSKPLKTELIAVALDRQILPGTFEHTLCYLVDHVLDLKAFHDPFKNDRTGRFAYDPATLLKIVLLAYSRGITRCRKIARLCQENILFMALSACAKPHFTTLADFVARSGTQIQSLFEQVLHLCDDAGLIGKAVLAVDGCKIPSNASKEWSGTHEDYTRKCEKIDHAVNVLLSESRIAERLKLPDDLAQREERQIVRIQQVSAKLKQFLKSASPRIGRRGLEIQSNVTDNESIRMKSSHGMIQGYLGVAAVDARCQIILHAQAFSQVQEQGLLGPILDVCRSRLKTSEREFRTVKVLADAGFHCFETLTNLERRQQDAYVADPCMRQRDPRFKDYKRLHKPKREQKKAKYTQADFQIDLENKTCICPAGGSLAVATPSRVVRGQRWLIFRARRSLCQACFHRSKCLLRSEQKEGRRVAVNLETQTSQSESLQEQMKAKLDTLEGRAIYSQRLGIVEPVFANLTETIGFKRFSYRGLKKVSTQWLLMASLHNLGKLHRYGGLF